MKQPENLSIAEIFISRVRYIVPMFQRHYVWDEDKQWKPLWEDIASKANDRIQQRPKSFPHFMGAIIYESEGGYTTKKVQVCKVIDGQQRLTTLQLFLAALRDVATSKGMSDISEDIEQYLFNTNKNLMSDPDTEIYKVWPTRFDRSVYSDMISLASLNAISAKYSKHFPAGRQRLRKDKTRDIPLILKGYMFFREQIIEFLKPDGDVLEEIVLKPSERLDALFRSFLEDFRIVAIPLDEGQDDPQVIFETLNDRGTPLLASDLIRNFIFYRAEAESKDPAKLYEASWSHFESEFWSVEISQGRLKRSRLEFFMQHFIAAKTGHEINLIKLFQEYKSFIQENKSYETIEAELEDIAYYAPIYSTLVNPLGDGYLAKFAKSLQPWDVSTVFPLVLYVMAAEIKESEKETILGDILSFIVRRAVCMKTPKNYNKLFVQAIRHLKKNGLNVLTLRNYFLSFNSETGVWPSDQEFETFWLDKPAYTYIFPTNRVNYILREIERTSTTKFSEDVEIRSALTIEHIMPQSWEENWPLQTGEKVTTKQKHEAEYSENVSLEVIMGLTEKSHPTIYDRINRRNRLLHTFGNLTLLTQPLNSSVGKSAFEKRRIKIIEQSALTLNRYFQNVDNWNEERIIERGKNLFKLAKSIWPHPGYKEADEVV